MALYTYYPGYRRAAKVTSAQAYQVPIYTWVEIGKCRLTSCHRTLVLRWELNSVPCDLQSDDLSTRQQHLYIFCMVNIMKTHVWLSICLIKTASGYKYIKVKVKPNPNSKLL